MNERDIKAILKDHSKPLKPAMDEYQKVAIMMKDNGVLMIAHTKPFYEIMAWAEFDVDTKRIVLMSRRGSMFDTGIEIQDHMIDQIKRARKVSLVWIVNKDIKDVYSLPIAVRDTRLTGSSVH